MIRVTLIFPDDVQLLSVSGSMPAAPRVGDSIWIDHPGVRDTNWQVASVHWPFAIVPTDPDQLGVNAACAEAVVHLLEAGPTGGGFDEEV